MKTWHEAISEKFYITNPGPGQINVWGKTKTGKKSRSMCGWDILNSIVKITKGNCPKFKVHKNHVEI